MRCKNCGTDNDDNRYICENCGSPLYDEEDISNNTGGNATKAFNPISDDKLDLGYTPDIEPDDAPVQKQNDDDKKSIIAIAVLVVVLIAIITSVIVVANAKKHAEDPSETTTTTTSAVSENDTTERVTTTTSTTTQTTTQSTTKATTTTTTQLARYSVRLVSKGGGTVSGAGTYNDGDNVTITAVPDDGYTFDGWYSNGDKISSAASYSFTATENTSISAVFIADQIEELNPEGLE